MRRRILWLMPLLIAATLACAPVKSVADSLSMVVAVSTGQESKSEDTSPTGVLHASATTEMPLQADGGIIGHIRCNSDGDLYFETETTPLLRVSADGQRVTTFSLRSVPDLSPHVQASDQLRASDVAVSPDGKVYVATKIHSSSYILRFGSDGNYESKTRLEVPPFFYAAGLAVFADGNFLVAGEIAEPGKTTKPLTALFDTSGRMLRKLSFQSDRVLRRQQPRSKQAYIPQVNSGDIFTSPDGNAYLMRRFSKPIVYVVSPTGQPLRSLTIESPKGFTAVAMVGAYDRLVFAFQRRTQGATALLYVAYDTNDGREVARYERASDLSGALACYTPDGFTFIGVRSGNRVLIRAQP